MFENSYAPKHHRGSSPPVREPEPDIDYDQNLHLVNQKKGLERESANGYKPMQDQDDAALWQDEGGEGG
ncbi:MAG: hypothetical protein EHM64_13500 [Ignavibacteriae bacterium]|nr:MAG: hypothetical protein EHM64_13500 [Ignavibacteriota bacterium]